MVTAQQPAGMGLGRAKEAESPESATGATLITVHHIQLRGPLLRLLGLDRAWAGLVPCLCLGR